MAKISLAGTPEICSSLLRSRHVSPRRQRRTLIAAQNDAAKDTRKGKTVILFKQPPSSSTAVVTTEQLLLSSTDILLHQFTKTPSTFKSTATPTDLLFSLLFLAAELTASSSVVLDTQEEDDEERESSSSSNSSGEQDLQRFLAGGEVPAPEKRKSARFRHLEQIDERIWRATRKLALWTLTSQLEQR